MGQPRSAFPRRKHDHYPTPAKAVQPLLPYLRGISRFAEPCCRDGALIRVLEAAGFTCSYAGDIADGQDALARATYGKVDCIITNPPYARALMHRLIVHFQDGAL